MCADLPERVSQGAGYGRTVIVNVKLGIMREVPIKDLHIGRALSTRSRSKGIV